ncbi:MAG TPA: cytochrome P450 [Streptosporangiaceae bacterium]|nr:cytochrome P450 [Streptosporangiaceae bacterium]
MGQTEELIPEINALLASLSTPEVSADPYPVYARLRSFGPVRWSAAGGVLFLTGYDDCAALVRDPAFGSQSPQWCDRVTPGWREHPARVATFEAMLFRDPPEHTKLRRLVSAAFTPRQSERMRSDVARLTTLALDEVAQAGSDGGIVDLQEMIAARLPVAVIGSLVGVPAPDWPELRRSISVLLRLVELSVSQQALTAADEAAVALEGYFTRLVSDRTARPAQDLASAVVAAKDAVSSTGDPVTDDEVIQTLTFVFMAGVDTMTNLLANGTFALLTNPRQADILRSGAEHAEAAVDEVLRYDAPVQLVGRVAAADSVIGGMPVRADELVLAILGAGNRDPLRFTAPDTFDITRRGTAPLSFGGGIHRCLGAPLARVEAGEFFTAILARFPALRLAGEPVRQGTVFRGFSHFPITVR